MKRKIYEFLRSFDNKKQNNNYKKRKIFDKKPIKCFRP